MVFGDAGTLVAEKGIDGYIMGVRVDYFSSVKVQTQRLATEQQ